MLLSLLLGNYGFQINILVFANDVNLEFVEDFVHLVHNVRVDHHMLSVESNKVVCPHIIC